jgi:predicted TIM-barrel fold metal-dependent hydrolase
VGVKLDAFCHVLPKRYFDRLQQSSSERAANLVKRTASIRSLWDIDERLRVIDPFDEYAQIISLAAPPLEALGDPAETADLARLANDELAELVRARPDTFVGFVAGLPMNDVDAALAEIDRAVQQLGALGIQIYTHVNGLPLDDPRFEPVFERMAELDRAIWVHPARNSSWPDYPTERKSAQVEVRGLVAVWLALRHVGLHGATGVLGRPHPPPWAQGHHASRRRHGPLLLRAGGAGDGQLRRPHA